MFRTVAILAFAALCLILLTPVAIDAARWLKNQYLKLMGPQPCQPQATRTPPPPEPPEPETKTTIPPEKSKTEGEL